VWGGRVGGFSNENKEVSGFGEKGPSGGASNTFLKNGGQGTIREEIF